MSGLDVRRLGRAARETSFRPAAHDLANEGTPRSGAPAQGSPFLGYFFWRSKRSIPPSGGMKQLQHAPHVRNQPLFRGETPLPQPEVLSLNLRLRHRLA